LGLAVSAWWPFTPAFVTVCEAAMSDPIVGFIIAIGLAAYLVYTLLRPEKF
jgi:K+-transporting ATPase KdpF subunit